MTSAAKPPVAATMLVGLGLWLALGVACGGDRPPPGQVPTTVTNPFNATGVCQHTCTPDPGPAPMTAEDCANAEIGLEFRDPLIWTFDDSQALGASPPNAPNMYSYTDNTASIASFVDTTDPNRPRKTYQPPSTVMARCGDPSNHVIHVVGGPFLGWGGGIGMAMFHHNSPAMTPMIATVDNSLTDLSQWEGVAFWARRGPDSQGGIRVLVGDRNTDDDISYLMYRDDPTVPRFCERVRECACTNHMACSDYTKEYVKSVYSAVCLPAHSPPAGNPELMSFCGEPHPLTSGGVAASTFVQCNSCQRENIPGSPPNPNNRCDEPYPAFDTDYPVPTGLPSAATNGLAQGDRQFLGKPCTPFTYRSGVASSFCYDPDAGETVADTNEQCGDHWTTPVNLTNNWQLYLVPFNSLTQQGWAKRFGALDVQHVSVVRFTWDGGWIDYYIDNVAFYRRKQSSAGATP